LIKWAVDNDLLSEENREKFDRINVDIVKKVFTNHKLEEQTRLLLLNYLIKTYDTEVLDSFFDEYKDSFTSEELSLLERSGKVPRIAMYMDVARAGEAFLKKDFPAFKQAVDSFISTRPERERVYEFHSELSDKVEKGDPKERNFYTLVNEFGVQFELYFLEQASKVLSKQEIESLIDGSVSFYARIPGVMKWYVEKGFEVRDNTAGRFLYALRYFHDDAMKKEAFPVILYMIKAGKLDMDSVINYILPEKYETLFNDKDLTSESRLELLYRLADKEGIDPEKMSSYMNEIPELVRDENGVDEEKNILNRLIYSTPNEKEKDWLYWFFTKIPDDLKVTWLSEKIKEPQHREPIRTALLSRALKNKNARVAWFIIESLWKYFASDKKIKLFQDLVKRAITTIEEKRTVDLETLLKILPLFNGVPLLGSPEAKFAASTRNIKYPRVLLQALIKNNNITVDQINNVMRKELGMPVIRAPRAPRAPRATTTGETPATTGTTTRRRRTTTLAPAPVTPAPTPENPAPGRKSETNEKSLARRLFEIGNYRVSNLQWSRPLEDFVSEEDDTTTFAKANIKGKEYNFAIIKRVFTVPSLRDEDAEEVSFSEYDFEFYDSKKRYSTTGEGNASLLFGAMLGIISNLTSLTVKDGGLCFYSFESLQDEATRIKLYDLFAKKIGKFFPRLVFLGKFKTSHFLWKWVFTKKEQMERLKPYVHELAESKKPKSKFTIRELFNTPPSYTIISSGVNKKAIFMVGELQYVMSSSELSWSSSTLMDFLSVEMPHSQTGQNAVYNRLYSSNSAIQFFIFYIRTSYGGTLFKITGTGNVEIVFANVVAYIEELFQEKKGIPFAIMFSSDEEEKSRMKLYELFYNRCSKLIPGVFQINKPTSKTWIIGNKEFKELELDIHRLLDILPH
jgi:hypothetical protein